MLIAISMCNTYITYDITYEYTTYEYEKNVPNCLAETFDKTE